MCSGCGDHFVDDPILLTLEIEHVRIAREFGSTLCRWTYMWVVEDAAGGEVGQWAVYREHAWVLAVSFGVNWTDVAGAVSPA